MAKKTKWKLVKKSAAKMATAAAPPTSGEFNIVANGTTPESWTVMGVASDGATLVPLPTSFTLTAVSDTPANVAVGDISGATFSLTAPGTVGSTAKVTLTATDSSSPPLGPFSFEMDCTVQSGGIVGIAPVHTP